jgi:hypothetical protein
VPNGEVGAGSARAMGGGGAATVSALRMVK